MKVRLPRRLPLFITHHKRRSIILLVIIVIIAAIFWPKPPAPLEVSKVKKGNVTEALSANGTIISESSVDLTFGSAGKVSSLNVKKGEFVEEGQVIATLDSRSVQKNLQSALRDYSKQRNTFDQTKQDKNAQKPTDALNDTVKRILENNQYDLEKAVISVELQQLAREQSVLISPIAGVVTRADISSPGVNAGLTTTFTVADPKNLIFRIEVDEADIGKIQTGQELIATFDSFPDQPVTLTISSIDFATHKTDTGGNAFYVESLLPENTDLQYRIGMSGDAQVVTNEANNVLLVPLASTIDENFVYVKNEKGFEKRKVTLGIANDTEIEVRSGVREGEEIAVDPIAAEDRMKNAKPFGTL